MSVTQYSEYSSRIRGLGSDNWLGSLCWFSVSESVAIDRDEFGLKLNALGLGNYLPPAPRDDNVFRQVCTNAQRRRVPTATGTFENILVRDVSRKGGIVNKQIVIEEVDAANKRLSYQPVYEVAFDGQEIQTSFIGAGVPGASGASVDAVLDQIRAAFVSQQGKLNSYSIREVIRRVFGTAQATTVRSGGGVYFVMAEHAGLLASLEGLAERVDGMSVHSLPLVDDVRQRTMVKEAFEAETVGEIDRRLGEIETLLKGPEIPESKLQALMAEMKELTDKTETYADLLEETMGNAEFRIKVYKSKIRQLFDHVKS